jgi:hypothetical protein
MSLISNLAAAPGPSATSGMIVGAVIFALSIIILAATGKERKLCDQARIMRIEASSITVSGASSLWSSPSAHRFAL